MARFEANDTTRHAEVDLHDFTLIEAQEVADRKVQEAWEKGYKTITLIHGSPLIRHHMVARVLGRGSIKWVLRGRLAQGAWSQFVYNRRSVKHRIDDGSMTLAVRPNPNPRSPSQWEPLPVAFYE